MNKRGIWLFVIYPIRTPVELYTCVKITYFLSLKKMLVKNTLQVNMLHRCCRVSANLCVRASVSVLGSPCLFTLLSG